MCKILVIPHVPEGKERLAFEFMKASAPFMSAQDKDGIGYAGVSSDGELFGEVWLNPKEFLQAPRFKSKLNERLASIMGTDLIKIGIPYRAHGTVKRYAARSLMLHTRAATCEKGIKNAHPFFRGDTALIHNGVIYNARSLVNLTSTCDSETILNSYVDNGVTDKPEKIQSVADVLDGWYACAVITKESGSWYVDVFKENRTNLVCAYVKELETVVFCTSEKILKRTARVTRSTLSSIHLVKSGVLYRFRSDNGILDKKIEFKPENDIGRAWYSSSARRKDSDTSGIVDWNDYRRRWIDKEDDNFDEAEIDKLIEAQLKKGE